MPRRNVNQQPVDISSADRLKVLANCLDVPARNKRNAGLYNVPRLLDELIKRSGRGSALLLSLNKVKHYGWCHWRIH
jgi:hypothetical protein